MIFWGIVIGMALFGLLCEELNKMEIKLLEALQKKTRGLLKKKKTYQYISFGIVAIIVLFITMRIGVSSLIQGFLLGAIWAFNEFIFEDSLFDKLRNNLR